MNLGERTTGRAVQRTNKNAEAAGSFRRRIAFLLATFLFTLIFPCLAQNSPEDRDQQIVAQRAALRRDPRNHDVRFNLANLLESKGNLDEAINIIRGGATMPAPAGKAWYPALYQKRLGDLLRKKGDLKGAVTAFRKCNSIHPSYKRYCSVELTLAAAEIGDIDAAVAEYRGCKEGEDCGVLAAQLGDVTNGVIVLRTILVRNPNDLDAHWGLATALQKKGELIEAIEHLRVVVRPGKFSPNGHLQLAEALEKLGRVKEAIGEYREVVREAPNTEVADTAQRSLRRLQTEKPMN